MAGHARRPVSGLVVVVRWRLVVLTISFISLQYWCGFLFTGTWVCAIRLYCEVFRTVAPKKAALKKAMSSLRVKQEALAKSKAELQEVSEKVAALQAKFDTSVGEKNRLRDEAEKLEAYLLRAQQLVEGLAGERVRVLCVGRVCCVCCVWDVCGTCVLCVGRCCLLYLCLLVTNSLA